MADSARRSDWPYRLCGGIQSAFAPASPKRSGSHRAISIATPASCPACRRYLVVTPDGAALPCHAARVIASLTFGNVRDASLDALWSSPAFAAFRGESWMKEPCRTCDRRAIDFGGCRCQAFLLTGDATATDPACARSPDHHAIEVQPADRLVMPRRYARSR